MSNSFDLATAKLYIYMGTPVIIGGVCGGLLNIIIFLSLQIYRDSPAAFYLTIMSIINIGQLLTGLLSRVLFNIVGIDWTDSSLIFCRTRYFLFQACAVISPTCLCLATIDQFLATSTHPRWQQWNSIKTARRLTTACIIFWLLYSIPYIIYYNLSVSPNTGLISCMITDPVYYYYNNNIHILVFMSGLPLIITITFGLLAYYNVRQIAYRTIPLVRRQHEVQLTTMVLIQIIFNIFATTPSCILRTIAGNTNLTRDPITGGPMRFAIGLTTCIYYLYYAVPFYIYVCVSERFRKQLRYVMIDIYLTRWRTIRLNEVTPQTQTEGLNQTPKITMETIELY